MSRSDITAVIVNHNGGEQIVAAIAHLRRQSPRPDALIVVDNGSTDGSAAMAAAAGDDVQVIELGQNLGPAIARNRGMQAATTTFVLLVDDDVYLAQDCIAKLSRHLDNPAIAVAVPRLVLYPENLLIQLDGAETHVVGSMILCNARLPAATTPPETRPVGAFSTSCVLARRDAMLAAGGVDENYFIYLEDQELGLRLSVLGFELICDATAVAFHDRGEGTPDLSFRDQGVYPRRRAYLTMRNRWQTILIHYSWQVLLLLAPILVLYELAALIMAAKRRWLPEWLGAWRWLYQNRASLRTRRAFVQQRRRIGIGHLLVAGDLPLAPGLIGKGFEGKAVAVLAATINAYWWLVRPLVTRYA